MTKQKSAVSLIPERGMSTNTPAATQWVRNLWRPGRQVPLSVRPGFGQREQLDSASALPLSVSNRLPEGGLVEHLGSALYRSSFGRRQIISIFHADCTISDSRVSEFTLGLGGFKRGMIAIIHDITTGRSWEELLPFKTSESAEPSRLETSYAHFETTNADSYLGFRSANSQVSFVQIGDSLYFCAANMGVWVYHGIDIPNERSAPRINSDNVDGFYFGQLHRDNNHHNGMAEGSVFSPVVAARGVNGEDVVYLKKDEAPRPVGISSLGGRVAFAAGNIVWFSDVGQPGSIMADNFAAFQSDGKATALASFQDTLFVFTDTEAHAFVLQRGGVAGGATPGVINISGVTTNNRAGCVSQNSLIDTPYGVCFVSQWGLHLMTEPGKMTTLSDPIANHWGEGILDPLENFKAGSGLASGNRTPPMLHRHEGAPSVSYDVGSDVLYVAYPQHILLYDFTDNGWSIWPLGVRTDAVASAPRYDLVGNALEIMSDDSGTYLLTGLYDSGPNDDTENYYQDPASLSVLHLGRGGARDRSIEYEDSREWGKGRYTHQSPPAGPSGGPQMFTMDWWLYITPTRLWHEGDWSYYEYQIDMRVLERSLYPANATIKLSTSLANGFVFDSALTSSPPEGFTFNTMAFGVHPPNEFSVTLPTTQGDRSATRLPLVRFVLKGNSRVSVSPDITVDYAEGDTAAAAWFSMPCVVWQQQGLYNKLNIRWRGVLPGEVFDGASEHERDIEWAICTGAIGPVDGAVHRVRDIAGFLESGGQDDSAVPATERTGIYNSVAAPDHRAIAMQRQDVEDPYEAVAEFRKKELLHERLTGGTRAFGEVAKWAPAAAPDVEYLADSAEINEINISTSAKGKSVQAAIFGRIRGASSYLRLHAVRATLQSYASKRRRGS